MDKNRELIKLTPGELTLLYYNLLEVRDHDWQTGHNICRKCWDLAKDYCAITVADLIPRFEERRNAKEGKENED